jgi:hypothetical protein
MNEIIQFLGDLLSKAEFWSISTLGVSTTSVFALLWTRRSNLALTASNILQKGLKQEISELAKVEMQMQRAMLSQEEEIKGLKTQLSLLNNNIYVLSQAANIGLENKEAIKTNYLAVNTSTPEITDIHHQANDISIKSITEQTEQIQNKSSLDELLKKI